MKTEWAGLMLDVANLMDKLASMIGRISKRETRKATKKLTPAPEKQAVPADATASRWQRKAELRRRRLGGAPASTVLSEETEPEEAEA